MEILIHSGNTDMIILKLNLVNLTYGILVEDSFATRLSRFLSSVRVRRIGGVDALIVQTSRNIQKHCLLSVFI